MDDCCIIRIVPSLLIILGVKKYDIITNDLSNPRLKASEQDLYEANYPGMLKGGWEIFIVATESPLENRLLFR